MSIPKCYTFEGNYDKYPGDTSPTTDAQMQDYFKNQNEIAQALADGIWQPSTAFSAGAIISSPNMAVGVAAVCTQAGTTSATTEPEWPAVGSVVSDGSAKWTMFKIPVGLATQTEAETGTDNTKVITPVRAWDAVKKWFTNTTATQAEAEAGTSNVKVMTPLRVKNAIAKMLAGAVFTAVAKTVAPASTSNDTSIPTTSWVRTFVNSVVLDLIFEDYLLAQNGYVKFANGLILQWGVLSVNNTQSTATFTYPLAMTTTLSVVCTPQNNASAGVCTAHPTTVTNTDVTVYGDYSDSKVSNNPTYLIIIGK